MNKPTLKEAKELVAKYPTENYYMVSNWKQFINSDKIIADAKVKMLSEVDKCSDELQKTAKK